MFFLDELYRDKQKYPEYPADKDYIDKYLFYRRQDDDIDVDACEQNMKIYRRVNPLISREAIIKGQSEHNRSQEKYELDDNGRIYRGETIVNCMQLLLQIVNYDSEEEVITTRDFEKIESGIKKSSVLADHPEMRKLLNEFVGKCGCVGNYFAIPYKEGASLNQAKGRLRQGGYRYTFVDSSDTYFRVCYNYFEEGEKDACCVTRLIDEEYMIWKERYVGHWDTFIADNCFQDFTGSDKKPIRLWNKTDQGFFTDLKNYMEKAIHVLSEREKRIKAAFDSPNIRNLEKGILLKNQKEQKK